jgi:hypothetical protein
MVTDSVKPIPTVDQADRPLRSYRQLLRGVDVDHQLASLDAYLFVLCLEFLSGSAVVTDLTGAPAEVSTLALSHQRVGQVVTWLGEDPTAPSCVASIRALRSLAPNHDRWEIAPNLDSALCRLGESPGELSSQHLVAIAAESASRAAPVSELVRKILDANSRAIVIVPGLGRIGECRALASLVCRFPPDSRARLTLARELRGMVQACSLGLIYEKTNEQAKTLFERIEYLFITNYDYLDLITEACARRDMDTLHIETDQLRAQLERERSRPLIKAIALQAGRRMAPLARKYRRWLAPPDSFRERLGKAVLKL